MRSRRRRGGRRFQQFPRRLRRRLRRRLLPLLPGRRGAGFWVGEGLQTPRAALIRLALAHRRDGHLLRRRSGRRYRARIAAGPARVRPRSGPPRPANRPPGFSNGSAPERVSLNLFAKRLLRPPRRRASLPLLHALQEARRARRGCTPALSGRPPVERWAVQVQAGAQLSLVELPRVAQEPSRRLLQRLRSLVDAGEKPSLDARDGTRTPDVPVVHAAAPPLEHPPVLRALALDRADQLSLRLLRLALGASDFFIRLDGFRSLRAERLLELLVLREQRALPPPRRR